MDLLVSRVGRSFSLSLSLSLSFSLTSQVVTFVADSVFASGFLSSSSPSKESPFWSLDLEVVVFLVSKDTRQFECLSLFCKRLFLSLSLSPSSFLKNRVIYCLDIHKVNKGFSSWYYLFSSVLCPFSLCHFLWFSASLVFWFFLLYTNECLL
jgi:hypothetical protein